MVVDISLRSIRSRFFLGPGVYNRMHFVEQFTIRGIGRPPLRRPKRPGIIVLVKSDRNTPYKYVSGVIEELKKSEALRVSFVAKRE